jgi:cyclopropane fatty-acyl-phospholipid synthase-like methyltransferase
MILSRTRRKLRLSLKGFVFDKAKLQEALDERHKNALEDSMGFRGQFDEHRRFQITLLKQQGLLPSHDFLEIGCGPLTGGLPVIEYLDPNRYVGVDIRSSVLDTSWGEVGRYHLSRKNPRLVCSSSFGANELEDLQFDFVLSFSVLFHLSDELLPMYFSEVSKRLRHGGRCFANVSIRMDDSTWLEFPFLNRSVESYKTLATAAGLATRRLGCIQSLGFRLGAVEKHNEMLVFSK